MRRVLCLCCAFGPVSHRVAFGEKYAVLLHGSKLEEEGAPPEQMDLKLSESVVTAEGRMLENHLQDRQHPLHWRQRGSCKLCSREAVCTTCGDGQWEKEGKDTGEITSNMFILFTKFTAFICALVSWFLRRVLFFFLIIIFRILHMHRTWKTWLFISQYTWSEEYQGFWSSACSRVFISHRLIISSSHLLWHGFRNLL